MVLNQVGGPDFKMSGGGSWFIAALIFSGHFRFLIEPFGCQKAVRDVSDKNYFSGSRWEFYCNRGLLKGQFFPE